MPVPFVHLHVHSAYSLLEGALQIPSIIELASKDGQPAVAVTDRNNLFGALEFSEKAVKKGLQPIMGCKLAVKFTESENKSNRHIDYPFLVLLAASETGFSNLRILISNAHLENDVHGLPHVTLELLRAHGEGIICLTGGSEGPINQSITDGKIAEAETLLNELSTIYSDRLYIELHRHSPKDR
ncbi:MAG: PHP domain-containing protein, partial [Pseudomonadota bacterium]